MDNFDEFSLISKLNRQKFLHLLVSVPGNKELVVEKSLLRPLDKLCSMSVLQSHGCVRVHQLLPGFPIVWGDGRNEHRFFFLRPTISLAYKVCELIRSSPSYNYVVILCGNRKNFFDRELEQNGLFDKVKFFEFDLDFVAIESDLFSLELPQYAPEMVDRYYSPIAKCLWKLQVLYGQIQTFFGIGLCFSSIEAQLKHFSTELGEAFASADQPISHIFLFDRRCDLPSVLLSGLTYESVLNDVFNYNCGKISFKEALAEVGNEDGNSNQIGLTMNGVYALNNSEPIFSAIRNAHMTAVFPFLSSRAKMLQASFEKASGIRKIDEMKGFVSSELRTLKEQQKQLELHIFACEYILKEMRRTNERFSVERAIVRGEFEDQKVIETLLKLIASKCNHWIVLQIACIWSLRSQGLKPKLYRQFQEAFLHRYGFEKLAVLYKLRQHFLLTEKKNAASHPKVLQFLGKNANALPLADDSKSTHPSPTLPYVIAALRLCPPPPTGVASPSNEKERDEGRRRNMAYVFSDAYIPLISHIVHGTVTNGWDETYLKRLFGEKCVHCSNPDARPPDNRIRRAILVCFVGGVTQAEVASLRRFAQDYDFRLIVLTTHIINREHFLQSYTKFTC